MPVENERKYVLDPKDQNALMNQLLQMPGSEWLAMRQGYLDGDCRIRQVSNRTTNAKTYNVFTYKTKVNGKQIEVETEIDDDDFAALWTKVGKTIVKHRIVVPTYGDTWEVDFFKAANKEGFYLVMAEVELPDGQMLPNSVPSFISSNLLHLVEYGDKRFNSKSLTKPATVAALLQEIRDGKLQSA